MHYYNQRIPVPVQRIEFKHILSGLQKSQSMDMEIDLPLLKKKINKQPKFFQELQKNEQSDVQQLQSSDTVWDEAMLIKLEKLRKQPNSFFEKIPKDPITFMNSSMKNKYFEIRLLAQSKEGVRRTSKDARNMNAIQETAVKELINKYPSQFNFTTSADARKKKEVIDTRDKYLKTFFIRSSSQNLTAKLDEKRNSIKRFLHNSDDIQISQNKEPEKNKNKQNNVSFQTWSQLQMLECPGYCTFVKELVKKNKQYKQKCSEFITDLELNQ